MIGNAAVALEKFRPNITGRCNPDVVVVTVEPLFYPVAANVPKIGEKFPVRIHLAGYSQAAHDVLGLDRMNQHLLQAVLLDLPIVDEIGDELNGCLLYTSPSPRDS